MTQPTDTPDDLTPEGILDELVVEALEHGDGGDGGAPPRKAGRAAKVITAFGLVLGGATALAAVFARRALRRAEAAEASA